MAVHTRSLSTGGRPCSHSTAIDLHHRQVMLLIRLIRTATMVNDLVHQRLSFAEQLLADGGSQHLHMLGLNRLIAPLFDHRGCGLERLGLGYRDRQTTLELGTILLLAQLQLRTFRKKNRDGR